MLYRVMCGCYPFDTIALPPLRMSSTVNYLRRPPWKNTGSRSNLRLLCIFRTCIYHIRHFLFLDIKDILSQNIPFYNKCMYNHPEFKGYYILLLSLLIGRCKISPKNSKKARSEKLTGLFCVVRQYRNMIGNRSRMYSGY